MGNALISDRAGTGCVASSQLGNLLIRINARNQDRLSAFGMLKLLQSIGQILLDSFLLGKSRDLRWVLDLSLDEALVSGSSSRLVFLQKIIGSKITELRIGVRWSQSYLTAVGLLTEIDA